MTTKRKALIELYLSWDCTHLPTDSEVSDTVASLNVYLEEIFYGRRRNDTLTAHKFVVVAQKSEKVEPTGVAAPEVIAREEARTATITQRLRLNTNNAWRVPTPTIHQDAEGRWRRSNGSFASIDEINAVRYDGIYTALNNDTYIARNVQNVFGTNVTTNVQNNITTTEDVFDEEAPEEEWYEEPLPEDGGTV